MQKKLLAVAVAGALGAPMLAAAQSTVQIYGRMHIEYSVVDQGTKATGGDYTNIDIIQTPGSMIGFRGEEKLGGGMSAWFQCESTADPRGMGQEGFCGRNSALGLRGRFGSVFVGRWDMPFKRTIGVGNVGSNGTGVFGNSMLLTGYSTSATLAAESDALFQRRQSNTINYDSPNMNGFRFMAAYTATNEVTSFTTATVANKPRIWSLGGTYSAGPLRVAAGYEQHKEAYAAGAVVGDATGYHMAGSYKFGSVQVGGIYTQQKFENSGGAGLTNKVRAWHLGVEWNIQGPHNLLAGYTDADSSGTVGAAAVGGGSGVIRPAIVAAGGEGAKMWNVRYMHRLSKRTTIGGGYSRLDNDANAAYFLPGMDTGPRAGNNMSAWGLEVDHRF